MLKSLEHNEHAGHIAHGHGHEHDHAHGGEAAHETRAVRSERFNQLAALLVASLAATLAITEQAAKHAEIRVEQNGIFAADAWSQYQAKSTRDTFSRDVAAMIGVLGSADPDVLAKRQALLDKVRKDADRFLNDPENGKKAVAKRAHEFEEIRDHSLEQTHAYHNGAAAMELGIVLSTASAILKSKPLIFLALGLGIAGLAMGVMGYIAPEYAVF